MTTNLTEQNIDAVARQELAVKAQSALDWLHYWAFSAQHFEVFSEFDECRRLLAAILENRNEQQESLAGGDPHRMVRQLLPNVFRQAADVFEEPLKSAWLDAAQRAELNGDIEAVVFGIEVASQAESVANAETQRRTSPEEVSGQSYARGMAASWATRTAKAVMCALEEPAAFASNRGPEFEEQALERARQVFLQGMPKPRR